MHSVGQMQLRTASSVDVREPAKFYFYVAVNCPVFLCSILSFWQTVHAVHHVVVEKCMQIVSVAATQSDVLISADAVAANVVSSIFQFVFVAIAE